MISHETLQAVSSRDIIIWFSSLQQHFILKSMHATTFTANGFCRYAFIYCGEKSLLNQVAPNRIWLKQASKMVFLSKPPHIPIDILYSSDDSWRLEFWLIHFPLIRNTISIPWRFQQSLILASVGPWQNNAYPLVATVWTGKRWCYSPNQVLLRGVHLWMPVSTSSRLFSFFFSLFYQWK